MLNMRAFATCLALAAASMAGAASGQIRTPRLIGDVSNPAQSSGFNAGMGSVPYEYFMSSTEVTVSEYADFLNSVAGASDPFSLYTTSMESVGLFKSGPVYSVTSGFGDRPISYVSWFSAARYVNWLNTGTTENGAYNLGGSNVMVGRTVSTTQPTWVLPNQDEWYKAAFYNAGLNGGTGGYSLWQVQAGSTQPTASAPPGSTPAANYNRQVNPQVNGTTSDVGAYNTTVSYYGMYDMLGNVTEWTEDAIAGNTQARVFSGAYTLSNVGNWNSGGGLVGRDATTQMATIGFRVAQVAPVPEPGTIALAASGLLGLGGVGWMKRRKSRLRVADPSGLLAG